MGEIKILSEDVVAAISAGEVVERPLSVVKELVENSIDAKADRIEVEIFAGGKTYIKVKDNGKGMSKEDLNICLLKHATSKINCKDDLFHIKTMGFRGEALYSISRVSEMTITTKSRNDETGHRLTAKGGDVISLIEAGAAVGTTIEVSNLFFNTPARKKFLKSENWEKSLIVEYLEQLSLIYPQISFFLKADGKDLLLLNKSDSKLLRIKQLFPLLNNKTMYNKLSYGKYEGEVFLSMPDVTMQNFQLFAVNNRPVKDRIFYKVINDLFSDQRKKSAFTFIDFHLPEKEVDINVHPAKKEVRFQNSNEVYNFLKMLTENIFLYEETKRDSQPLYTGNTEKTYFKEKTLYPLFPSVKEDLAVYNEEVTNHKIIGVFSDGFILIEKENSLLIIDQHAAHERLIFDKLISAYENKSITSQMIIPYVFSLSQVTLEILEEIKDPLSELGFNFEQVAPGSVALKTLPPYVSYDSGIKTFLELIEDKDCLKSKKDIVYKIFSSLACREAVKKNDPLTKEELNFLIKETFSKRNKPYCPHGRNYIIEITLKELEKRFGRKD